MPSSTLLTALIVSFVGLTLLTLLSLTGSLVMFWKSQKSLVEALKQAQLLSASANVQAFSQLQQVVSPSVPSGEERPYYYTGTEVEAEDANLAGELNGNERDTLLTTLEG